MDLILDNKSKWKIEKLSVYKKDKWQHSSEKDLFLEICNDFLFIKSDEIIIEHLKLTNLMKGYCKCNTIIIAFSIENILNKIKMKLECTIEELNTIKTTLGLYFPFYILKSNSDDLVIDFKEKFTAELTRQTNYNIKVLPFPSDLDLNEFLKKCILDPSFPDMVDQVEQSIHKFLY